MHIMLTNGQIDRFVPTEKVIYHLFGIMGQYQILQVEMEEKSYIIIIIIYNAHKITI